MTPNDWIAISSFVTVCSAALALVIKQLEQSRCSHVSCLCMKCRRVVGEDSVPVSPRIENPPRTSPPPS